MAGKEPDYGEEQVSALLNVVARVANGAPLQAAAAHEGGKGRDVLEVAMNDAGVARALIIAQNERAYSEARELSERVHDVESAVCDLRVAIDLLQP